MIAMINLYAHNNPSLSTMTRLFAYKHSPLPRPTFMSTMTNLCVYCGTSTCLQSPFPLLQWKTIHPYTCNDPHLCLSSPPSTTKITHLYICNHPPLCPRWPSWEYTTSWPGGRCGRPACAHEVEWKPPSQHETVSVHNTKMHSKNQH